MNYFLAILAGAVQGLTEFLPVSSTGHLIIFEHLFNLPENSFGLAFDASLHLGTLLAIIFFFWKDYLKALNPKNKLLVKLIVGTIPAAFFGLMFNSFIESQVRQLWIIGLFLIIFSAVMVLAERSTKNNKTIERTTLKDAFIVGLFQSIALIPGVSRSGSTISAGLFLNMTREEAARFAFMLSGPVIAGAGSKKFLEVIFGGTASNQVNFFIVGIVSSAIFGYLTIKYFLKYLTNNSLRPFIYYRVILGLVLIIAGLI